MHLKSLINSDERTFAVEKMRQQLRTSFYITKTTSTLLIAIMICIFFYNLLDSKYPYLYKVFNVGKNKFIANSDHFTSEELLISLPFCKIPNWNPFDPSVKRHFKKTRSRLFCPGKPSFLRYSSPNAIVLDEKILRSVYNLDSKEINCTYKPIIKDAKDNFEYGQPKILKYGSPSNDEFLDIECSMNKTNRSIIILKEIKTLVPDKPKIDKVLNSLLKNANLPEPLNVLIVGIDSISKLNFLRHFTKTYDYLRKELKPIELYGYNKVGDNSFPNLIALLTGIPRSFFDNHTFFDSVDFVWNHYAERGFRTLYLEDMTDAGTFNSFGRKGFTNPPVHYYFRPASYAMEHSSEAKRWHFCYRNKMEVEFYWNYLKNFVQALPYPKLYFAFTFVSRIVHGILNHAGHMDFPTLSLLKFFKRTGTMDNTIIFLFSDHGIRFGPIRSTKLGRFEDRLPIGFLLFPKRFLLKYPKIKINLEINQRRLVTLYDIHATLVHFLNFTRAPPTNPRYKFGISLFSEIPKWRTCATAGIPDAFCSCNLYKDSSVNNTKSILAAKKLVERINLILKDEQNLCHRLTLAEIFDARFVFTKESEEIIIVVRTTPGDALFEGLINYNRSSKIFEVNDEISRINLYGNASHCVQNPIKRKYCYCIQTM